ncbi:MAG: hypothetical protein ACOX8W_08045 [bacterium]
MAKTVIGTFASRSKAEEAVRHLSENGFDHSEISVVAKNAGAEGTTGQGWGGKQPASWQEGESRMGGGAGRESSGAEMGGMDEVYDGISTGTLLGGLGGLLAGAGAFAIPGIGPLLAAGPIAAALTGAVTGGVAGGLLDFGIPAERSRHYENEVKSGKILAVVHTSEKKTNDAAAILRQYGAGDVEIH